MRPGGDWLLDPSIIYLNHGSFGACPVPVLEAQAAWRSRMEAEPVRFLARELEGCLDRARSVLGEFLRADPDGLAFVPNATTGVSTVLASLRFAPGDELLTTDHEYNATINALEAAARRDGARVVVAAMPFPIGSADEAVEAVLAAVSSHTRLALVSHVTSPTALVLPIGRIVAALADRGVDTLVDGAHAPGAVEVDVDAVGAAYWTGNGHKWLCGPKGSAVLWVRADRRDAIRPLVVSHGFNDPRAGLERSAFRVRFDWQGTSDPTPYLALADGIPLVGDLAPGGWPALMERNRRLALAGRTTVAEALGVARPAPAALIGSMASLPVPGLTTDAAALALHEALLQAGFEVPVLGWPVVAARAAGAGPRTILLRLSAQAYNEPSDYAALAAALPAALSRARARADPVSRRAAAG